MMLEGETELRLKARTKFEKYDKYSRSETNRFGIVKSEDQNMSPTKTTRQRSYNMRSWSLLRVLSGSRLHYYQPTENHYSSMGNDGRDTFTRVSYYSYPYPHCLPEDLGYHCSYFVC